MCFFGRCTHISHFYKYECLVDGQVYNCIEQYIQKTKAEILHDDITALKILTLNHPIIGSQLTKSIITVHNRQTKTLVQSCPKGGKEVLPERRPTTIPNRHR